MGRKQYASEQIITKLGGAEVLLNQGTTVIEAVRQLRIAEQTYYRWKEEYGGMRVAQTKQFKELERENDRLKKLTVLRLMPNLRAIARCFSPLRCNDNMSKTTSLFSNRTSG